MADDLETLKWQNWSAQQRFDSQSPEAQAKLVEMYHNNVLPYVAQTVGQDPAALQQQFVMKYPEAARAGGYAAPNAPMMQPDPLTVQPIAPTPYAPQLTPEQEQEYLLTGKMPRANTSPTKSDPFEERRRQIETLKSSGGLEGVSPRAIETYMLTGKADSLAPADPDPMVKQRVEREQYLAYVDEQFPGVVTPKQRMTYMLTGDAKALLEPEAPKSDFDTRSAHADRIDQMFPGYVTPEMRRAYVLTGDESVFNTGSKDTEMAQRRSYLDEVEAQFPGAFTGKQKAEFLVTGDKKAFATEKPAAGGDKKGTAKADADLMKGIDLGLSNTDNALRAAENLIELTGGTFDAESGASEYEGRGFNMPVAGPFSRRLANSGTLTFDANSARAYLKTLKASAVFKTLQDLREAASNGSSGLGQVTNVEIDLLGSRIAALDIDNLDNEQMYNEVLYFAQQLVQVRKDLEARKIAEQALRDGETPAAPDAAPGAVPSPATAISTPAAPAPTGGATGGQGEAIEIPQDVWDEIIGGGN